MILVVVALFVDPATSSAYPDRVNWDAVAQCESGGNWSADTGNGFYGGLQFKPSTWAANGGVGSPAHASRGQQIAVANRVLATQGPDAWPECGPGQPRYPGGVPDMPWPGHPIETALRQLLATVLGR